MSTLVSSFIIFYCKQMRRASFVRLHVVVEFTLNLRNIIEINIDLHPNLWESVCLLGKIYSES